jgi:paraquat-inducible protein B
MFKKFLTVLAVCLLVLGCKDALNFKIRYDKIQGLKQGDRVIFEENNIGGVTHVLYTAEGTYVVDVAIQKEFANAATEYSQFFIIADPQDSERKAIEIVQTQKGGTLLQADAVVDGSSKPAEVFSMLKEKIDKGFANFKNHFDQFLENLKGVPESEAFKKIEKELDRLAEDIKNSEKSAREKMEGEILPRLQQEIEKLRERLRELGREDEVKRLDEKIEKLKEK